MASSKKQPRVVAVPLTAIGHVTAAMHICSCLHDKYGLPITMATVVREGLLNLKERIEQRGTWPPPGSDINVVQLQCDVPGSPAVSLFVDGRMNLTAIHIQARDNATALEKLVGEIEEGVSVIISDYQYCDWVVDVGNKLGIPVAILFTGSSTWSWFDVNMPSLVPVVPMKDELLKEEEDTLVLESPPLWRSDIPWHFWNDKSFQDFTLKYNVGTWDRATWILVNTVEALEEDMLSYMVQRFGASKYLGVGPLCLLNNNAYSVGVDALDRSWVPWLDEQANGSVLYIAFGSMSNLPAQQVDDFVLGLEASQQKFLWVLLSTDGCSDCLQEFVEGAKAKGQGMVVPWAPQLEVLSHKAVAAFLSHCGWNSTTEGVTSGKPMICWPMLFEQNHNARMLVEEWKVGTWMTKKAGVAFASKDQVETVITAVMEGDEGKQMRSNAEMLRDRLLEAVAENGPSSRRLNAFAEEILQLSKPES